MADLAAKIRKSRESQVTVEGHTFTVRRPTDLDMARGQTVMDLVLNFVVGWNLTELDLFPGGSPEPAPFDPAAWREWVSDRPTHWEPISTAVRDAYNTHAKSLEDAAKN